MREGFGEGRARARPLVSNQTPLHWLLRPLVAAAYVRVRDKGLFRHESAR